MIGPWHQDGDRWVRRWVTTPLDSIEGEDPNIVAIVEQHGNAWGWVTPWDVDGFCTTAERAMAWCDDELPQDIVGRALRCEVCRAAEATIKGANACVCVGCSTWADFSGPPGDR